MVGNSITASDRAQMKVYAAREYKDETRRMDNYVEVNLPEYLPTVPQNDKFTKLVLPEKYFRNINYPAIKGELKCNHFRRFPIMAGTRAPVRFRKGAEFLLVYPSDKIEEGTLVFIKDRPDDENGPTGE